MSLFNPSKLSVTLMPPITPSRPIEGRRYTLTHSDQTGQLFLTIGPNYETTMIDNKLRDEVIAEWLPFNGEYKLFGRVHISSGEYDEKYAKVRFMIFQKELSLAIKAIVYGDQTFYCYFPWLLDAPIYIQFDSIYPAYHQVMYYGTPRQYLTAIYNEPVIKTYANELMN
jgi:hypothetical protein